MREGCDSLDMDLKIRHTSGNILSSELVSCNDIFAFSLTYLSFFKYSYFKMSVASLSLYSKFSVYDQSKVLENHSYIKELASHNNNTQVVYISS